jgi:hypothetical protein
MQIRFKLGKEEFSMLRAHFCPEASTIVMLDSAENGWEDVAQAQLGYLLKNSLGKGGTGGKQALNVQSNVIKPL